MDDGTGVGRDKSYRLKQLVAASQALAEVESVDELLPTLLLMAQDVTQALASSIMLYNPDKDVLQFALAMNESREGIQNALKKNVELKLGQGIAGWVAQTRQSVKVDDASSDSRLYRPADKSTGFVTKNLLCVPIQHNGELLGVAQVLNAKGRYCFDDDDMELLESFAHLASVALIRRQLLESRLHEQKMQSQLEAAARIQQQFIPADPPAMDGLYILGKTRPAVEVGGDLYDFIDLDDGSWIVCVADISGKGLPAAMVMAALWSRLRSVARKEKSISEIMHDLNGSMFDIMGGNLFATAVACRITPSSGQLDIALAGHCAPVLITDGVPVEINDLLGLPLGIEPEATFVSQSMILERGQSLVLVTDGVTEARSAKGEFYEPERMMRKLTEFGTGPFSAKLLADVDAWRIGRKPNDDTTIVELFRTIT